MSDGTNAATGATTTSDELGTAEPTDGLGLCLSGGGYRAMVFHIGAVWRLHDAGLLPQLTRVSSVSGGSITAAWLGLKWKETAGAESRAAFEAAFVTPLRGLAAETIDCKSTLVGAFMPGNAADSVARAYAKHLFGKHTLQDLPDDADGPRFVINATSVQSLVGWRFSKPYMGDYRVGLFRDPDLPLARAVAASSAFPPFLSPCDVDLEGFEFDASTAGDLTDPDYRTRARLTDGGVYDNLGLETVLKRCRTLLVSDGGGGLSPKTDPTGDWPSHTLRTLWMIDRQVGALRKRDLIDRYVRNDRDGAYWSIASTPARYGPDNIALPTDAKTCAALAAIQTRLAAMSELMQCQLINWGYAITDTALRAHVDPSLPAGDLPYPSYPV